MLEMLSMYEDCSSSTARFAAAGTVAEAGGSGSAGVLSSTAPPRPAQTAGSYTVSQSVRSLVQLYGSTPSGPLVGVESQNLHVSCFLEIPFGHLERQVFYRWQNPL